MKKQILLLFSLLTMISLAASAQNKPGSHKDSITVITDADSIVFLKTEKPAEFPGGVEGWRTYLETNLRYPEQAQLKGIQGIVRIQFIVEKDGTITEVVALNNPGGGLAEEALRIFKNGPKWVPAEQNGRKVRYRHIQNITFRLT